MKLIRLLGKEEMKPVEKYVVLLQVRVVAEVRQVQIWLVTRFEEGETMGK